MVTLDCETEGIENRPEYPPKLVGLAIQLGRTNTYMAYGHPTKNNCTKADVRKALKEVWYTEKLIFHNAAFDIEVLMKEFNLPFPTDWEDTLILAYLNDPRDISMSLKPLAAQYLGMPPEEQDILKDWVIENYMKPNGLRKLGSWGAYICKAPGDLCGKYAKGDIIRTKKLFNVFYKRIKEAGMLDWYAQEKKVIQTKLRMEQGGIKTAHAKLGKDIPKFKRVKDDIEKQILTKLKVPAITYEESNGEGLNVGSNKQLADALDDAGLVNKWILTEKGNRSVKRENLEKVCEDKVLVKMLSMHSLLTNYIGTFIEPWYLNADDYHYLYPSFNTVRSSNEYGGGGGVGTRTGRLSSSDPNFQNIPANLNSSKHGPLLQVLADELAKQGVKFIGLRDYLIPDDGCVFIARDYSQQEIRILAHYENGPLLRRYQQNPKLDVHEAVRELVLAATGNDFPRKAVKIVNFGIIYGMGVEKLANAISVELGEVFTKDEAALLKRSVLSAIPGIEDINREMKRLSRKDKPLYTWGGRQYYCEEFRDKITGELIKLAYKMLNLLVQGSAADCTKVAMTQVEDAFTYRESRLVVQVHDELLGSVPKHVAKEEMKNMKEGMEDVDFDLPMLTDGEMGARSWARLAKCA